jgi:fused signal recognition particle receptor
MFGFLKQKLADFGNKLKQTISKEETQKEEIKEDTKKIEVKEQPKQVETKKETPPLQKETKIEKKEIKKVETKKQLKQEETKIIPKQEEKKIVIIEETKPKQIIETKKEQFVEEEKPIQKETVSIEEKAKPKGILSKLFGIGKKETKPEEIIKETKVKEVVKEKEFPKKEEPQTEAKKEPIIEKEKSIIKKDLTEIKPKIETLDEVEEEIETAEEELIEEEHEEIKIEKPRDVVVLKVDEDKRELKANIGVGGGLKGLIFGGVEISEKQIEDLLWELELSLIESDVEQEAARELVNQIKQKLIGKKVSAKNIDAYLQEQIKEILASMMNTEKINVLDRVKEAKKKGEVYKILILGPNGAGKTTTIAKLVNYFQKNKLSCILAAGDTFRAGAIDQIEVHAKKLGVRVIKHQYGADPAAIAFDAISAATAGKIDVVLIDSAGRQETNKNLMEELKKLERVAKPNLKLFVGESYVGQGLLDQVEEFEKIIGLDGYILTKLDTDAKGGTAISLTYKTKKPIIFIGTGQGYDDFEEFSSEYILNRII